MLHHREFRRSALSERMRGDIFPLALVGLGLAWLTLAGRRDGAAQAGRRLLDELARLQHLARELLAFLGAGPIEDAPAAADELPTPAVDGPTPPT
jgi:hypothetical protein